MTDLHVKQTRNGYTNQETANGLNQSNGGECGAQERRDKQRTEQAETGRKERNTKETMGTDEKTGRGNNTHRRGEEMHGARETNTDTTGEKYTKELTVEVEVEGEEKITMMDILKEVKKQCGDVVGCRVKGDKTYEITMNDLKAKEKLLDGVRIRDVLIQAKDITNDDMVVSFINLPVYLEDSAILTRLLEWGVRPISPIKRRKWPGTDIADGTRFLRVRFNQQVRSLPYSTKFETAKGMEYYRVIHDRQVRVCRLCIKPGHIFRECPEFRCFKCQQTGHYARECVAQPHMEREKDEEGKKSEEKETQGEEQTEENRPESGSEMEELDDGESEDGDEEQQERDVEQDGEESAMEEEVEDRRKELESEKGKQQKEEKRREEEKKNERKSKKTMGSGEGGSNNGEIMRGGKGQSEFEYQDITDSDENKWEELVATRKRPLGRKERPEKAKKKNAK